VFNYKKSGTTVTFFIALFIFVSSFAKTVEIIAFSDFHGQVNEDTSAKGKSLGIKKFVTAIKNEEKNSNFGDIVVAAGDDYQGTALSTLTKGAPVSDMMKEVHLSASAVGNHEFDWGIDCFKKWQKDGGFPFVAANIINRKTKKPVKWTKPYIIVVKDGVKVAFIGLATTETPSLTAKKYIKNIEFTDSAKAAQQWIDFLNAGKDKAGKPDVIIALTHIPSYQSKPGAKITGKEINNLCNNTKGLDAVISAHEHKNVCGKINNIPIVQVTSKGTALSILKIEVTNNNKLVKVIPSIIEVYKNKNNLQEDKEAALMLEKYLTQRKELDATIGKTDGCLSDKNDDAYKMSNITTWVAKAMAEYTDSQVAIMNSAGVRTGLKSGDISVSQMFKLIPFDNSVVTMQLPGKDLKRVIQHGLDGIGKFYGLIVYYTNTAQGKKIVLMTLLNGTIIETHKYYKVTTVDFIFNGGIKFDFSGAKDVFDTHEYLRNILIDEIKKKKNIHLIEKNYLINEDTKQKKAS
jgi:2',3'-cyclic-nucleotide 2'-phosphodiesterase (5'-nucleotidase family)